MQLLHISAMHRATDVTAVYWLRDILERSSLVLR